jgi:hypothetical protein
MIYLTVGNKFGGIYKSQVLGVCRYLNTLDEGNRVTCVSFIPVRDFFRQRKTIKAYQRDVIVLPVFFKSHLTLPLIPILVLLCLFRGEQSLMGRGAAATRLGLLLRNIGVITDVIYDGRGAHLAELEEYGPANIATRTAATHLERNAVLNADYRLAVSEKLVEYWTERYGYNGRQHLVVPCTVDTVPEEVIPVWRRTQIRQSLGLSAQGVVLVYCGSSQAYQSFDLMNRLLSPLLEEDRGVQLLLLSNVVEDRLEIKQNFPDQVFTAWVKPEEVVEILSVCDYGIMLREMSVTNQVSAPTKFAEYLAAGLPVLISEGVGDYSGMVERLDVGVKLSGRKPDLASLTKVGDLERKHVKAQAKKYFAKPAFQHSYEKLLDVSKR